MGFPARKLERRFTLEDYAQWPADERWELINGEAFAMTPAPSLVHQSHLWGLAKGLDGILDASKRGGGGSSKGPCALFIAPVDVVLGLDTVVQPDILVVCDPEKRRDPNRIMGAPDLVVEIISPNTAAYDRWIKRALYERSGVPEYLILDPLERYGELFTLQNGCYSDPHILQAGDYLTVLGLTLQESLGALLGWE